MGEHIKSTIGSAAHIVFLVLLLAFTQGCAQAISVPCQQCRERCVEVHRITCKADACTSAGGRSRPSSCEGLASPEQNRRYVEGLRVCEARERECQNQCTAGPCQDN